MSINFITRQCNEQGFQDFYQILVGFLDIGLVLLDTKLLAPDNKKMKEYMRYRNENLTIKMQNLSWYMCHICV